MIGLRIGHLIKSRISAGTQFSGIKFLIKSQKRTEITLQYVKQTTFATTISSGLFLSRTFNVPRTFSIIYQCRPFHATRPTSIPTFLITFKTINTALAIRNLSNLLFSFLPFALRKNPKTGRRRPLFIFLTTVIPLTGFCILILAGIEQAPHTGRFRFNFMSEKEELEICNLAFSTTIEKYRNKILSENTIESMFVDHVVNNLVKGLNNDLMTLKSFKNLSDKESSEIANIIEENVDNMSDKNTNIQGEQKPKPFEVYVIKDDEVPNAFSFGASKKIIIFTGWLKLINYDEEYLAVTLSHEIAHIIQGHSSESFGFSQILYMFADTARTLLWSSFLSALGPLLNDYLNSATQGFVEKYSSGRYNQKAEKEADIVGLQLMALSGYHPKKAIELWKYLSSLNNSNIIDSQDNVIEEGIVKTDEEPPVLQSLEDFFASHPLEEVRAKYLFDMLPEAEKIYEVVVAEDGRAILFMLNEPIKAIKNTEDQIISKFWNSLKYILGLNPDTT
ncbi:peptidase family M48-domain-containing protein [Glomus cerebriforme]|uniref:Peptidase family M48-domain-containing protein n=1 Tax=Glomus cerebriforme TaxID=658196 RepID=A0A397S4K2_9GLOM|nr:peptidase family M48-domain-containing protein [Glomus cerebriforme]